MNKKRLKVWLKKEIKKSHIKADTLEKQGDVDFELIRARILAEVLDFIKRPKRMRVGALMEGSEYSCVISLDGNEDIKIPSTPEINAKIIKRLDDSHQDWLSKRNKE